MFFFSYPHRGLKIFFQNELREMKNIILNFKTRKSLFDFIFMNRNDVAIYSKNEVLKSYISQGNIFPNFSNSHATMYLQLRYLYLRIYTIYEFLRVSFLNFEFEFYHYIDKKSVN